MFKINNIYRFKKIDSTNSYLSKHANDYENGSLIVAEIQTNGKGRLNRTWNSKHKDNLYLSFIIKDYNFIKKITQIPIICSIALFNSINFFTKSNKIKIKWPNDIIEAKTSSFSKISGILIENFNDYLVVGMGVNLNIAPNVESIRTQCIKNISGASVNKNEFINVLVNNLNLTFKNYAHKGFDDFINIYNNSLYKINERITFFTDKELSGILTGIDENGFVILNDNSIIHTLFFGELINSL